MTRSEFNSIIDSIGQELATNTVNNKKRIAGKNVEVYIRSAYIMGANDSFNIIQENPDILRRKIGFIQ